MGSRVFIDLERILAEHGVEPRGIAHVGAHTGEEVGIYHQCGFDDIQLFEAHPWLAAELALKHLDCTVHSCAITEEKGRLELIVPLRTQESSLREDFAGKEEVRRIWVDARPLHDFDLSHCNVLVIDVQGGEMGVLRSTDLKQFDLIICEVCYGLHDRPDTEQDIERYVTENGFRFVADYPHDHREDTFDRVYLTCRLAPSEPTSPL